MKAMSTAMNETPGERPRGGWAEWGGTVGRLLVVALIVACASGPPPPPVVTTADIVSAEQAGTLEALYAKISAQLAAATPGSEEAAQLQASQTDIGKRLASAEADRVRATLAMVPRVDGLLPLSAIEEAEAKLAPIQARSSAVYQLINAEIGSEAEQTRAAIAEKKRALEQLPADDLSPRVPLLETLAALHGAGEAQSAYASQRAAAVAELTEQARAAIEAEDYERAQTMLETIRDVRPGDENTEDQLATVNTKVFLKNFFLALENGDPDKGYDLLQQISQTASFDRVKAKLLPSKEAMEAVYVEAGAAATRNGNVEEANDRFLQARQIQKLLGRGKVRPPAEEAAFLKLLDRHYQNAVKNDAMGTAWGYLQVIKTFDPKAPNLRRRLRETKDKVLQRAIKRLSAAPFRNREGTSAEFGQAVGSKVVQYLFETIPNDVRIIEREQLSDIIREKTIEGGAPAETANTGLAAADYLVQGTILEARVDGNQETGKITKRVKTGEVEQPNPDYNIWAKLPEKQRSKTPEPTRTIMAPSYEDINIEQTIHRKVGIFSVSYRVIDSASGNVIFADSVRQKAEYEDSSTTGHDLGDFKLEAKHSALPSDIEILAELSDGASAKIGQSLAEVLANPEKTYREKADRYAREDNFGAAAQQYAYAIVLMERKGQDVKDLTARLRESAIAASERLK